MTVPQQSPYLRVQRNFPKDNIQALTVEIDRFYTDAAAKINAREIGVYPLNTATVTGQQWVLAGQPHRQQTLRKLFNFTGTGNVPHGLNFSTVSLISPRSYGTFTDGTNWYGAIYAGSVAIAGQVSFYVTPTNIVIVAGAGAPTITNGYINLEWLSQF